MKVFEVNGRFWSALNTDLGRAFLKTLFARGIAAVGSLLLGVTLGRFYGADGVGVFALAQSILFGAGILTRFGMDNALMRYAGRDHDSVQGFYYFIWAARYAVAGALIVACLLLLLRTTIAGFFSSPSLDSLLLYVTFAVPPFTANYLLAGYFKGVRCPASACFLESGYISLVAAFLLIAYGFFFGVAEIHQAGAALSLATWLVFFQGCLVLFFQQKRYAGLNRDVLNNKPDDPRGFFSTSRAFFVMSLAEFMQNVLVVFVAAFFLNSHDLGLFKAAERSALLIGFVLMLIAAVFPPRFSTLYHHNEHGRLIRLARQSSLLGAALSLPMLLICLFFPGAVLSLFGSGFSDAAPYLRILALAQAVNVSTAAVGFLLNMTGHEILMRNIALISTGIGVLAFVISIPAMGALGAALSLSLVLVLQNIVALFFVRQRLGFWLYPAWSFYPISKRVTER
ncbi:oligosaccharide flippase family protein [Salinicola endophyticus]|uniref:Oligosaccharide flippase family protein n=1 Tax=Salinicola endophyticus TaxID=1949083 RepID=A0AB74UHT2_9GAMM